MKVMLRSTGMPGESEGQPARETKDTQQVLVVFASPNMCLHHHHHHYHKVFSDALTDTKDHILISFSQSKKL